MIKNIYKNIITFIQNNFIVSSFILLLIIILSLVLVKTGGYSFMLLAENEVQAYEELNDISEGHTSKSLEYKAAKIDAFYASMNLPLEGYGHAMVTSAEKYGLDWNLVASIGFIESTGGKFACTTATYNAFGWGSCKISFDSYEEAIDDITAHLAGKKETTRHYYEGKNLSDIIDTYNPPSVRKDYNKLIMQTMRKIEEQELK